ncbi:hypothetical protein DITRI_Ditri06bG0117500 [Diplodiscus trichospermus]
MSQKMNLMKKKKKVVVKESFLERKRKKTWQDAKSGRKCFMLYARSLYITWSQHEYWNWKSFKDTSDENIEVAKLSHVCWLDVTGKIKMSELSPATLYEVVFEVKLTKGAFGWEHPVKLILNLLNGRVQERRISLLQKQRGQWMELYVGNFLTDHKNEETRETEDTREVSFVLQQLDGQWKNGLVVKGAILRHKS